MPRPPPNARRSTPCSAWSTTPALSASMAPWRRRHQSADRTEPVVRVWPRPRHRRHRRRQGRPPKWIEGLAGFMKILEPSVGASVRFEGDSIVLSGQVNLDQRRALRTAAESAFPGARLQGQFEIPAETPAAGTIAPEVLAKNLNQMPLKFDNGGGNVSVGSLDRDPRLGPEPRLHRGRRRGDALRAGEINGARASLNRPLLRSVRKLPQTGAQLRSTAGFALRRGAR